MLNLRQTIAKLDAKDIEKITAEFKATGARKFLALFSFYRDGGTDEKDIREKMNENHRSFYVLKSRLYNILQKYLLAKLENPKSEILKKLLSLPSLLFETDREIAKSVLKHLDEKLTDYDMPNELTGVYKTLKKAYFHSDKYYHYSQLYNKHVAYTLALDKAEDLIGNFIMRLGEYYLSRDPSVLQIFPVIKEEMDNVYRLYTSHHLQVYLNLLNASMSLFLDVPEMNKNSRPVEDILRDTDSIFQTYRNDITYHYLKNVFYFLSFEYYHSLKIQKKEEQYFDVVNAALPEFLYYNFYTLPAKFLVSKLELYAAAGKEKNLAEENKKMFRNYSPDENDIPNYINFKKYLAASSYYNQDFRLSVKYLLGLVNEISFKNYPHAEIEIKLLLVLCHLLNGDYDIAFNLLKNTTRKITELNTTGDYENAQVFSSLLKTAISSRGTQENKDALMKFKKNFELLNAGHTRMLQYIRMDEKFITDMARPVKK